MKKGNYDHKFLRYPDLWDEKIDILRLSIPLHKVYLEYARTVKDKLTGNDSYFIAYSNTINFLVYG